MVNVMKAQLYQLKRDKLVYGVFLAVLIMQLTTMVGEMNTERDVNGCSYLASVGSYIPLVAMIFVFVLIGEICGRDFMDKTSNYELMSGHTRGEVYFGRAILSLLIGTVSGLFLTVIPILAASAVYGWGGTMKINQVIFRLLLLIFPILRMICEFVFLAILARNSYIVMLCGYFVFCLGQTLPMFAAKSDSVLLGITNLNLLCSFDSWYAYGLGGSMYYVYDASISASAIANTVSASVIIGTVFLLMGYFFFQKDDLS
jgi:ABC-type transport system involved in multi-copper enzyme maturation permease subunit